MPLLAAVDTETQALILIGDDEAWGALAEALRRSPGTVAVEPAPARPALRPIGTLEVGIHAGPVMIETLSDRAKVSGDVTGLARLADEVARFVEHNDLREPGVHAHVEAGREGPGGVILSVGSRELVLVGPVSDQ